MKGVLTMTSGYISVDRISYLKANTYDMRLARVANGGVNLSELLFGRHDVRQIRSFDEGMIRMLLSSDTINRNE